MKTIIGTAVKRPVTVSVLVIILLATGVLATMNMSTNLLPNMNMPMVGISVVYPGASAVSVEKDVTEVVENTVRSVSGIDKIQTFTYDNVSVTMLTFAYGTVVKDKIDEMESLLKTVALPSDAYEPTFTTVNMNGSASATVALYGKDMLKLSNDAKELETLFKGIEGVGSVKIVGSPEKQIQINALNGLDIASLLIVQALTTENLDIPLGTILTDGSVVAIRNASDATNVIDVMRLPAKLELSASFFSTLTSVKNAVRTYTVCTLDEFEDYVAQALNARKMMAETDDKSADDLEEQSDSLATLKSIMALVRENDDVTLSVMWKTTISPFLRDSDFANLTDDELQKIADSRDMSLDLLKWVRDGAKDGTLETDWQKLVEFRKIYPLSDTNSDGEVKGDDITYDDFAYLFQKGNTVVKTEIDADGNGVENTYTYEGLDVLHREHDAGCYDEQGNLTCEKEIFTHDEAADACEFADSVNTLAFDDIIESKRDAEKKGEQAVITDEQYAALFTSTGTGGNFAALMSPETIHIIRNPDFETVTVKALREAKLKHVITDVTSPDYGKAVYQNGFVYEQDDDGNALGEDKLKINLFGRLTDKDGNVLDSDKNVININSMTAAELSLYYYGLGDYIIFGDDEYVTLYGALGIDDDSFGITPTNDTVRFIRTSDFSKIVTDGDNASLLVPLYSLGRITDSDHDSAYASFNGDSAVVVEIYTKGDANTASVVGEVKKIIAASKLDSELLLLDDKAEFIGDSIGNVLTSIIIGGVLAIIVIYLFVKKVRSSLVVSVTMPLSVLVALLCMWAMNISLNIVSLGGLAVGIGMLVDNSIVVLESITKRRDLGDTVKDSCLLGTKEVAGSLLASTLTNVCVFFPILFAQGLTREVFYDLVWAVIFSIAMSLIVAVTVIPSLYNLAYRNEDDPEKCEAKAEKERKRQTERDLKAENKRAAKVAAGKKVKEKKILPVSAAVLRSEDKYGKLLEKVLGKRILVCVVALVLFTGSIALVFTTGTGFLPSVDKGIVEVDIGFKASDSLQDAKTATDLAEKAVKELGGDNRIKHISATVGMQGLMPLEITGKLRIQLDTTHVKTSEMVRLIREKVSVMGFDSVAVKEMDGVVAEVTSGIAGMAVTIVGDDLDTLTEISAKAKIELEKIQGIASVTDNTAERNLQYSFVVDKYLCAEKGVDYSTAVMMLRVGIAGHTAATITSDGVSTDIVVSFDPEATTDINSVMNLTVGFGEDGAVKVADILKKDADGKIEGTGLITDSSLAVIKKMDGRYESDLDIETYGIDMGTASKRVQTAVNEILRDYEGYECLEGGVASYLTEALNGLVVSIIAAFLLLYGVMACQFESLVKPFIVIMSIPFAMTGGFIALAITGTTLNVVSFVGLIMLMGVIVNGAIVMIDKIDMLIKDGMAPNKAVIEGCKSRLRPILMTTLTTVLALVPLALGLGSGGELMQPMGIVVLGGLTLGTLVTLVLIPAFYSIVKHIRFDGKSGKKGKGNVSDPQNDIPDATVIEEK